MNLNLLEKLKKKNTQILNFVTALAVFERKILRGIYGPVKEKNDGEFDETMN
jgi:hypothetical protein